MNGGRVVGRCGLIQGPKGGIRKNCVSEHIGELSLVGSHAERGIPLGKLRAVVALPHGQFQIGHGNIVLVIHEVLVTDRLAARPGHDPHRPGCRISRRGNRRKLGRRHRSANRFQGGSGRPGSTSQDLCQGEACRPQRPAGMTAARPSAPVEGCSGSGRNRFFPSSQQSRPPVWQ